MKRDEKTSDANLPKDAIASDTKRALATAAAAVIVGIVIQYGYVHDWHFTKASQDRASAERTTDRKREAAAENETQRQRQISEIEAVVVASLKDPESAQFRDIYIGMTYACGQVNAKNSFGGYSGFVDFYVSGVASFNFGQEHVANDAKAYIRNTDLTDTAWGHVLPDECLNHWAEQRGERWLKKMRGL